ncbi:hypothetical protein ACLKA6_000565 [Drosophila palustris]
MPGSVVEYPSSNVSSSSVGYDFNIKKPFTAPIPSGLGNFTVKKSKPASASNTDGTTSNICKQSIMDTVATIISKQNAEITALGTDARPTACSMQSPLKRRCIDMDEDDDDLPLLDQNLATPIFKSGFATKLNANRVNPKDHQQHPTSQHRQQPQTDNRRRQQSKLPRQLAADNPHSAPDYNENLSYSQVVRGVKNVAPICNLQSTTPSAITPKYAENSEKSSYSRVVRGNGIPAARPRNPAQKHLNKLQQQLRQRQQQRPAAKKSSATPSKQTAEIRAASSNTYNQVMSGDISTDRVRNPAERHLAKLQQQLRDEQQQLHVHAASLAWLDTTLTLHPIHKHIEKVASPF